MSGLINDLLKNYFSEQDITSPIENSPPNKNWKPSILEDKEISKTLAGDLIAEDHKKIIALATPNDSAEQECCQHPTRPCKHWQWDTNTGEGYKNILSGRFREAD